MGGGWVFILGASGLQSPLGSSHAADSHHLRRSVSQIAKREQRKPETQPLPLDRIRGTPVIWARKLTSMDIVFPVICFATYATASTTVNYEYE